MVAEAQNQEYQAYWQQYQQQWSQWAAWNQYAQQQGCSSIDIFFIPEVVLKPVSSHVSSFEICALVLKLFRTCPKTYLNTNF